jgi:hypothetical protein
MTITELVPRALAQRYAAGGDPNAEPLTPAEHAALVSLHAFLARFVSNAVVRAASPEDRAKLEELYAVCGGEGRAGKPVCRDAHMASRAQSFIRATTRPQRSWLAAQLASHGVLR